MCNSFPWPHDVKDPYGLIASDDERFVEACEWSNRTWQEHQEKMRALYPLHVTDCQCRPESLN